MSSSDPLSVSEQVEALVARVRAEAPQLGHAFEARSALAVSLAKTLETAEEKHIAALTKELRALIAELADGIPRAGDETPFGSDLADVRHPKKPRKGDTGGGRGKSGRAARPAADAMAETRSRRRPRD